MDNQAEVVDLELSFWDQHRYLLLIAVSISLAMFLVGVSMALYASSGAAQLDLSRPGYSAVTSQVLKNNNDFEDYSSSGDINKTSIDEFRVLYERQATKAKAVDAFRGDPLDPAALELNVPATD